MNKISKCIDKDGWVDDTKNLLCGALKIDRENDRGI